MPALGEGSRVVALSSSAHQFAPVLFDDISFKTNAYDKWAAYGQSKTANALAAMVTAGGARMDSVSDALAVRDAGMMDWIK